MENSLKPTVVISKCLGFANCRYDGQGNHDEFVTKLEPFVNFITVCPEVEIGLGIPRETIRVVLENDEFILYQPATGNELTKKMNHFSNEFLSSLTEVDGFILKGRSPSCGIKDVKVYLGKEKATGSKKGMGFFAKSVIEKYPFKAIEEEGRLKNFRLREHFLTKLFTLFNFQRVKALSSMAELVKFQSDNKYLLMAYHQTHQKNLGKIVANHEKKSFDEVIKEYEYYLGMIFSNPPRYTSIINALQHIFGYFSKDLSAREKDFLLNSFEEYRSKKVPLSVPLHLLKSYAIQFKEDYLLSQTIFNSYPEELIDISDSGK